MPRVVVRIRVLESARGKSSDRVPNGVLLPKCAFSCTHRKEPQRGGLSGVSDDVSYNEG